MKHTFIIGIDDGGCRYEYPLVIKDGQNISIHDIYLTLCKAYDTRPSEGIYCPSKANAVKTILDIKE
jgi:uncharacterized hydantoinase/oxoprolinase family protein